MVIATIAAPEICFSVPYYGDISRVLRDGGI